MAVTKDDLKDQVEQVYRSKVAPGLPDLKQPDKEEIKPLLMGMIDFSASGPASFAVATKAQLDLIEPSADGARGEVVDDPVGETINGIYGWSAADTEWTRLGPRIDPAVAAALDEKAPQTQMDTVAAQVTAVDGRIVRVDQQGVWITDPISQVLKFIGFDGAERGLIWGVEPSPYAGVWFVDRLNQAVTIASPETDLPPAVDLKPYLGPALYAVEGEPSHLVLSGMLADRSVTERLTAALLPQQGLYAAPREFRSELAFDAGAIGPAFKVAIGPMESGVIGESAEIPVRIAANPGAGSPVILTLGDSLAYRGGMYWLNQYLTDWGYTPTFTGTLLSRGADDLSADGGLLGEPKPGFELGDFTNQSDPTVPPLAPGQEATYAGMSVTEKRAYNTLLREPDGDDPEDIVNGYVVDFDFYFTRHGITPATCLLVELGTNDIKELMASQIQGRFHPGLALLIRRWRAYHPTYPLIFAFIGTARTADRDALWPRYIDALRALRQAQNEAADPNVHLVWTGPHVTALSGYDLEPAAEPADPITGAVSRSIADGTHATGGVRVHTSRNVAATIAFAVTNIVEP